MAHFAKIQNDVVVEVLTINNDDCGGGEYPESEPIGQAFIASCGIDGLWLQTSYHANFRGKYAGISDLFDVEANEFVAPPSSEPAPPLEP